jgi:presenilin-like A22 family membrane protease
MNNEVITQLIVLFLVTQALGLAVGATFIQEEISTTIVNDNPEDPVNAVGLIVYILVLTGALLLVITIVKTDLVFKIMEALAVFATSFIVFGSFLNNISIVLALSLAFIVARMIWREHLLLRNVAAIISSAAVGALIGVSLGIIPILIFMVLLSVYDFIAVFKTKHMVTLAKSMTQSNVSFTYAIPTKKHVYQLGTGDMVVPLAFAASVLHSTPSTYEGLLVFAPAIVVLIASLMGLIITLDYASQKKGRALPALPLQALLMLITYGILLGMGIL